jgi:hypothetical protein
MSISIVHKLYFLYKDKKKSPIFFYVFVVNVDKKPPEVIEEFRAILMPNVKGDEHISNVYQRKSKSMKNRSNP